MSGVIAAKGFFAHGRYLPLDQRIERLQQRVE
jgi:hypothetical protein